MKTSPADRDTPGLIAFDHEPLTRVVFGPGSVERLGEFARLCGGQRVLLVTDRGIAAAGHLERARRSLEAVGAGVTVFDRVIMNPTTRCVEDCREVAREAGVDLIVGLGGGSSLDTAKGCNFLLTNGGRIQDYWGVGKATRPMLPFIAIPTTAGTGSECQSFALITDEVTHQKMACGDRKAAARVAILDPALTLSQPPGVTARTGIDAIAHAVESAVTTKRNDLSLLYSHRAFRLTIDAYPRVLDHPADLEARGRMLLGAAWAGTAIENSMLGAAHAAANPLTARYGIIHGEAVGLMLPWVVRFNAGDHAALAGYHQLACAGGLAQPEQAPESAAEAVANTIEHLLAQAELSRRLSEHGAQAGDLPALAEEAARQWTGKFNPRPVTPADFETLYRSAFDGTPLPR